MASKGSVRGGKSKSEPSSDTRPRNILDSSAPKPRGKEPLVPKEKKPKTFRKKLEADKTAVAVPPPDYPVPAPENEPDLVVEELVTERVPPVPMRTCDGSKPGPSKSPTKDEVKSEKVDEITHRICELNMVQDVDALISFTLHSTFHREYARQALTNEIEYSTYNILVNLLRFQDRAYNKAPEKIETKRRFVCGFNQVNKFVRLNKAKAVIIAADIDIIVDGVLDKTVDNLIFTCEDKEVPVIFSSTRNRLARAVCKVPRSHVSCVAILDYSGVQDEFIKLLSETRKARELYEKERSKLASYLENLSETILDEIYAFIKVKQKVPQDLLIHREAIFSPLERNVYSYIRQIKRGKP